MPAKNLTDKEKEAIIKAPVNPNEKITMDPWPGMESSTDPSRVDRIIDALKNKLETQSGFAEPEVAVQKVFLNYDNDKSGEIDEQEFIRLATVKLNFVGFENDVKGVFKRFDINGNGKLSVEEFVGMLYDKPSFRATTTIGKIREVLARRAGGVSTLKSMASQFRIMDKDKSGLIDRPEMEIGFEKFLRAFPEVKISKNHLDELFTLFDADKSGTITYDEFIKGIRGGCNEFRRSLVELAFKQLDTENDGEVTLEDLAKKYDVSGNPLVKSGKATPTDVLRSFMRSWQLQSATPKDKITLEDFYEYYDWVSPSIDRDDYFELMIRNAWHIMGGKGWSQNTANLRVLVTWDDGHQSVEAVDNDLGLDKKDNAEIIRRLRAQGIKAKAVSLKDASEI